MEYRDTFASHDITDGDNNNTYDNNSNNTDITIKMIT